MRSRQYITKYLTEEIMTILSLKARFSLHLQIGLCITISEH